jgi:hypothetical protein
LSISCGDATPEEFLVEDLRILNIKTEPPELALFVAPKDGALELKPDALPAPDLRPLEVSVLAAHPDLDAALQFDWIRCAPGLNSIPCEGNERVRLSELPGNTLRCSPVEILLQELTEQGANSNLASGFNSDPRELLSGLIANVNVEVKVIQAGQAVDTPVLEGKKRIVLFEPRLVAQTILTARDLDPSQIPQVEGIELPSLCTNTGEAQILRLFDYLENRTANRNPIIERIDVGILTRTDSSTVTLTSTTVLTVSPGQTISIEPILNEDAPEKYQVIDGNCELLDFDEDPTFSWFTNAGDFRSRRTRSEDPLNIYSAPELAELTADETKIRIFMVVRDGRGGSDHRSLDLLVVR